MEAKHDRRSAVILSKSFNGIDFVEIADDTQTTLRVHFLNDWMFGFVNVVGNGND